MGVLVYILLVLVANLTKEVFYMRCAESGYYGI